jgi:hypothetical protein
MNLYRFVRISGNKKTGPIPVVTSQSTSCPAECPLNTKSGGRGCYAAYGNSAIHWRKLDAMQLPNDKTIFDIEGLSLQIKALPKGQLWRFNEAGDLPKGNDGMIDHGALRFIVDANKGRKGFTYTHYNPHSTMNAYAIKKANDSGFTINLSANNAGQADQYIALGIAPVVTLLPIGSGKVTYTPNGNRVVRCPAEYQDTVTCANCGLCQHFERNYVVGFTAHGTAKKAVSLIATTTEGE